MDKKLTIIGTICARGGSKGVKNKNIRFMKGKPLIAYTIQQAIQSALFDVIAVSSDSEDILSIAHEWGANFMIHRPLHLATDKAPKIPVIQHAVDMIEREYHTPCDYVIDLDATSPLRSVDDIISSFHLLVGHQTATNLITAAPSRRSPYFNMVEMNSNGFVELAKKVNNPIHCRQDAPLCYDMNASIYVWKREALFEMDGVIGDKTIVYVMPEERSIDIDTPLDWKFVELLLSEACDATV